MIVSPPEVQLCAILVSEIDTGHNQKRVNVFPDVSSIRRSQVDELCYCQPVQQVLSHPALSSTCSLSPEYKIVESSNICLPVVTSRCSGAMTFSVAG